MNDKKEIDNKYIKVKTLGCGGEGVAYLVVEKDTELELVAKTIEQKWMKEKKEYNKDVKFEKELDEAKRMFKKISSIICPYIIRCIREGKGEIKKKDKVLKIRQLLIWIIIILNIF